MLEALATFAAAFAAFAAGAAPSVTFGDSGEFAASAAILGLPHAPDYPLYSLAARAFGALVPLGNWAYRCNLLSAACAAGALALLGAALRRLGCSALARGSALLALALCPLWRYEAGVTEVFGPHLLACAAVLWLLARPRPVVSSRPAAALGLVFGLGAGVHQTLALAGPAVLARAWTQRPPTRAAARGAAVFLVFCALGLCCYAYLPLRAAKSPPLDWGHPVDAPRVARALLRRDYGSLALTVEGRGAGRAAAEPAPARAARQLGRWALAAGAQLGWPLLAAALLGLLLWPADPGMRLALAAWAAALGPAFLWLGDPPFDAQTSFALERFYLASWLGVAALAAAGVEALSRRRPAWGAGAAAAVALGALLPQARAAGGARGDLAAYDYGRSLQNSLPSGAALFMDGGDDTFYSMAFMTYAQRRREDVELRDRGGLVFASAYGADFRRVPGAMKEPVREAVEAPLALEGRLFYSTLNPRLLPRFPSRAWGLLRRPWPPSLRESAPDLWAVYPERFRAEYLESRYRDRALAALYPFQRGLARAEAGDLDGAYAQLALARLTAPDASWTGPDVGYEAGLLGYEAVKRARWPLAERFYRLWSDCAPSEAEPLLNLGVVALKSGRPADAQRLYERARALEPASPKPPYNLGALYWGQGRWAAAADELEAAHRLAPADPAIARFAAEARRRAASAR